MQTLHEERDHAKTLALQADMERDGWVGPPLVTDGDQLINGTHRYLAAQEVGLEVPTIELEELYITAGLDMTALHKEYDYPTIDEPSFVDFIHELPEELRTQYGIDLE